MKAHAFALSMLALLLAADTARGQSVTGKWYAEFDSQAGVHKYTYTFKVEGEKVTGTATGQLGDHKRAPVAIKEGKIKGAHISFIETVTLMDMEIQIKYTGKIVGDEIRFTREVGKYATEQLIARRVPAR